MPTQQKTSNQHRSLRPIQYWIRYRPLGADPVTGVTEQPCLYKPPVGNYFPHQLADRRRRPGPGLGAQVPCRGSVPLASFWDVSVCPWWPEKIRAASCSPSWSRGAKCPAPKMDQKSRAATKRDTATPTGGGGGPGAGLVSLVVLVSWTAGDCSGDWGPGQGGRGPGLGAGTGGLHGYASWCMSMHSLYSPRSGTAGAPCLVLVPGRSWSPGPGFSGSPGPGRSGPGCRWSGRPSRGRAGRVYRQSVPLVGVRVGRCVVRWCVVSVVVSWRVSSTVAVVVGSVVVVAIFGWRRIFFGAVEISASVSFGVFSVVP